MPARATSIFLHPIANWHGWGSIIYQGVMVMVLGLLFNTVAEVWLEWRGRRPSALLKRTTSNNAVCEISQQLAVQKPRLRSVVDMVP